MAQWGSVADTGSLEPIPDAVAWAQRADAWAQQPATEQAGEWEQPASRWSEVVPTNRPGLPAEGVGWRTETAEWRAAEQTARWRQTTEWRSASGTHGWRSTTEAWQTGSGAEGLLPPTVPPVREQLAISGTAWPTPQNGDQTGGGFPAEAAQPWQQTPDGGSFPSSGQANGSSAPWQQFADGAPSWPEGAGTAPTWQQAPGTAPPWQQAAGGAPAWQQAAGSPPSWQQAAGSPPPWEQGAGSPPPWEQGAGTAPAWQQAAGSPPPWEQGANGAPSWQQQQATPQRPPNAPWQQPADPNPAWQQPVDTAPAWQQPLEQAPAWQQPVGTAPAWQQPVDTTPEWQRSQATWPAPTQTGVTDDGRHLVREDDRAQRRRDSAAGMPGVDDGPRPGRRRAAETGGTRSPGGTGWTARSDADNWAGHADTGSMPMFQPPPVPEVPTWGAGAAAPSWRDQTDVGSRPARPDGSDRPTWQRGAETPGDLSTPGRPTWQPGPETARDLGDSGQPTRQRGADLSRPGRPRPETARDLGTAGQPRQRGGEVSRDLSTPGKPGPETSRDLSIPGQPTWQRGAEVAGDLSTPGRASEPPSRQRGADAGAPAPVSPTWRGYADRPREIEAGSWPGTADTRPLELEAPRSRRPNDPPGWQRDGETRPVADAPNWQREDTPGPRGTDLSGLRRDPDRPREIEAPRRRHEGPNDTPPPRQPGPDDTSGSWREAPSGAPGWQRAEAPGWRGDVPPDPDWRNRSDSWRTEPDSGSWARGEDSRTDGWRRSRDADEDGRSRRDGGPDTGSWRRESGPAADPWGQSAADTGVIPMAWQPADTDTGSWRSAPDDRGRAAGPARRRTADESGLLGRRREIESGGRQAPIEDRADAPVSPEVWRRDPGPGRTGPNRPADGPPADWRRELREEALRESPDVDEAVTEIRRVDPGAWQIEERERAARGSATYREANTGDWRRALAADGGDLEDGESRRFGTQDFVPFRPVGSAPVAPPSAPGSAPPDSRPIDNGSRQQLLVGNDSAGNRWQDPPDTQWPPRGATNGYQGGTIGGSYERRSVSSLPGPSGRRNNLLEPEDDEIEDSTGGPLAAVGYTVIWYGVPVVLFVLYMLVLNGSQQAHALSTLAGAAPQFALSLVLSMMVAVGLRWASGSWKAASVGLAAAVLGGGLATVLTSAITGNSLS